MYDGGRSRLLDEVTGVFQMAARMYCGQLTEEARIIQQQELILKYGSRDKIPPSTFLGPIQPDHLIEARRRLVRQGIVVPAQPRSMFLKRR